VRNIIYSSQDESWIQWQHVTHLIVFSHFQLQNYL